MNDSLSLALFVTRLRVDVIVIVLIVQNDLVLVHSAVIQVILVFHVNFAAALIFISFVSLLLGLRIIEDLDDL